MPAPTITEPPTAPIREGPENDGPAFPPITVKHVQNCAFSSWYPTFASSTLKSRIIPLSEEFIEYLESDGVFLPLNGYVHQQGGSLRSSNSYHVVTGITNQATQAKKTQTSPNFPKTTQTTPPGKTKFAPSSTCRTTVWTLTRTLTTRKTRPKHHPSRNYKHR